MEVFNKRNIINWKLLKIKAAFLLNLFEKREDFNKINKTSLLKKKLSNTKKK